RLGSFDAVVDFHSYPFSTTSAGMALASGAPRRVGFRTPGEYGELSKKVFNLSVPVPPESAPERDKSFLLTRKLIPGISPAAFVNFKIPAPSEAIADRVRDFYRRAGVGKKTRVLALHPTLLKKDNRWAPENYARLAQGLKKIPDLKIV